MFPGIDHTIKMDTVQFLKERRIPGLYVYFIAFENVSGEKWREACGIKYHADGSWVATGTILGMREEEQKELNRRRAVNYPWVSLSGGGCPFWAGGPVFNNGFDVARVRIHSSDGVTLEDEVEQELVFFLYDGKLQEPLVVEMYDSSDNLLYTFTWPQKYP